MVTSWLHSFSELNNLLIAYKLITVTANNFSPSNDTHRTESVGGYNFTARVDDYSKATLGKAVTPLSGVPFSLSKKFSQQTNHSTVKGYQNIGFKNAAQIHNQYEYNFAVENSVLRDQ